MRQYSVFSAMWMSPLFHGDLYRDMGRQWRGIGLRLLLLVLAVTWIAEGVKMDRGLRRSARDEAPAILQDFPPITITNGVVSSPVEQPYFWKDKSGKTFAVVDTTGEITSLDGTDAMILLTQNKLHVQDPNSPGQTRVYDLSQMGNFDVDRTRAQGWVDKFSRLGAWICIPIAFVGSLIYRLIQGLIYAAIGLIWNSAFNAKLSYGALMRLAFVSVTPAILLSTITFLLGVNVPAESMICLVIAMVYLAIAVKANQQPVAPPTYGYGYPAPGPQSFPPNQQQPYPPQYPPQAGPFPPQYPQANAYPPPPPPGYPR